MIQPNWNEVPHTRENNRESESLLQANMPKIKGDCKKVYDLLMSGKRLKVLEMTVDYGISSPPRRILDLKRKLKLDIKDKVLNGRIKEYYLEK